MLRYSLGLEHFETRPATDAEKAHVHALATAAIKRSRVLGFVLLACVVIFFVGIALIFSFGMLIVMIDLFVMGRLVLVWGDARKPIPFLRQSMNLTDVAVYGDPSDERSNVLHPTSGLLISQGGVLINAAIQIEGAVAAEPQSHPEAGWYSAEREFDRGLDSRPLSQHEVKELRRLGLIARPKFGGFFLFAAWIFTGGLISAFDKKQSMPIPLAWLCGGALVIIACAFVHLNRPVFLFWRDRRAKQVLRVEDEGKRVEFLPHSRLIWTIEGDPSEVRQDGTYRILYRSPSRSRSSKKS